MKQKVCFVVLLSTMHGAWAQVDTPMVQPAPKLWLTYGMGSYHTERAASFNQHNPGLGVEVPFSTALVTDTRWVAGRFKNSDNQHSNYVGALVTPWTINVAGTVRVGALVAAINGYTRVRFGAWFPMAAPVLRFEVQRVGANLFIIPPVAGIPATFALQLKVEM